METWSKAAFAGYLAAMIDGEGCIELISDYSVRIRIANTVEPTLRAIVGRVGFGRVIEYKRPPGRGYKRLFCAEWSNCADVTALFKLCGSYIHMKRDQMAAALAITSRVFGRVAATDKRNRSILRAIDSGEVQGVVARRFGVSPQLVSRIKSGHLWPSVIAERDGRKGTKRFPRTVDQSFRLHT